MVKRLAKDSEKGIQMDLLKLAPNFSDVGHFHESWEWVYILEGSMEDHKGKHVKGDFLLNDTETLHQPSSKEGCLLLIVWCGSVSKETS